MNNNIAKAISDYGDAMLKAGKAREVLDRLLDESADNDLCETGPDKIEVKFPKSLIDRPAKVRPIDEILGDTGKDTTGVDDTEPTNKEFCDGLMLDLIQRKINRDIDLTPKEGVAWDKHLNSMKEKPSAEEIEADVGPERKFTLVTAEYLVLKHASDHLTHEEMEAWIGLGDDCNSDDPIKVYEPEGEG